MDVDSLQENYTANKSATIQEGRVLWIDVMRGICILLVVLGHSIGDINDPLNRFILSFHMPAFFFLSGLCAKNVDVPIGVFIRRKVSTILVPQIVLAVINIIWLVIFERYSISADKIIDALFSWFLIVLFMVSILYYALDKLKIIEHKAICIIVTIAVITLIDYLNIKTAIHIEIVPMALLFYLIGNYSKGLFESIVDKKWMNVLIVFLIPCVVMGSYWNKPVAMYLNQYGNLLLFFACALAGILMLSYISQRNQQNFFLQWLGQNSIIIYIFHFKLLNLLHGIGVRLFPRIAGKTYAYPAHWHFFVLALLIIIPIVLVCNRWLPFLFGHKRSTLFLNKQNKK